MANAEIHADTHVFGSTRGYGTVASSRGVREDEARELESFQFGEASTADRIARLETHAVMTGRALRSGRFAISRMMPAGVDDAGRPTVEVITLLVDARDYAACVGALPRLASDARFWLDARMNAAGGTRIAAASAEPAPRDPQVLRLFDLWRGAVRHGAIGVVSEADSATVLRLVASLDPADLSRCRWGIGLLSVSAPADICSVASGVSMHGARDVMRPAQQGAWHCGSESEYAAFRGAALPTLPSVADIELNGHTLVVAGEGGVVRASAVVSPRRDARERRVMPFAIGSAVLSTAVLAVAVVVHGRREDVGVVVAAASSHRNAGATDNRPFPTPPAPPSIPSGAPPSSTPPAIAPTTPPATAPSTPPATAPSTPPATAPNTPPATAPSTLPTTAPSASGAPPVQTPVNTADPGLRATDLLQETVKRLRCENPLRFPDVVGTSTSSELSALRKREMDRAEALGKDITQTLSEIVELDQLCKQDAKKYYDNAMQDNSWTMVTSRNGFIFAKPQTGGPGESGQDDSLLNAPRVSSWIELLDAIVSLRQGAPKELEESFAMGIKEFQASLKPTESDRWKRAAASFLLDTGDFNRERLQAQKFKPKPDAP